jgi:hypothetical protein
MALLSHAVDSLTAHPAVAPLAALGRSALPSELAEKRLNRINEQNDRDGADYEANNCRVFF